MKKYKWISQLLAFLLLSSFGFVHAQEGQPEGPVYIVQSGDSLWSIALRFGVSLEDLSSKNQLADPSQLAIGTHLIIPGLEGMQGFLVTREVPFGETLGSLSRRYQAPAELLARLNHLASPDELYTGSTLVIPETEQGANAPSGGRAAVRSEQSLLEIAMTQGVNPWTLVLANDLQGTWEALPGDVLHIPGVADTGPGALPGQISEVSIEPLPFIQGRTLSVRVSATENLELRGSLGAYELHFFPDTDGTYVALQGVHAMTDPGLHPLTLEGSLTDGTPFGLSQMVNVLLGNYPYDRPLTVDPKTIDPEITGPEDKLWQEMITPVNPERYWDGAFHLPSPLPQDYCLETGDCWSSRFGNRRAYNGSAYNSFHTGLDIVGKEGREIYAPAPGMVIYTGSMTVRGNATIIDHGWGVYTAYGHQSEILVGVGDIVETGQKIGLVGKTGRVEGPHLHWEVIVGGVQVDPIEWLERAFP